MWINYKQLVPQLLLYIRCILELCFYETKSYEYMTFFCNERDAYKLCACIQDSPRYVSVHYRDVCGTLMRHQLCANNITIHNTSHCLHDNVPWPVCTHYTVWWSVPAYPSIVHCVWLIAVRNTPCNFVTTMLQLHSRVNSFPLLHVLYRGGNRIRFSYLMPHTHNGRVN